MRSQFRALFVYMGIFGSLVPNFVFADKDVTVHVKLAMTLADKKIHVVDAYVTYPPKYPRAGRLTFDATALGLPQLGKDPGVTIVDPDLTTTPQKPSIASFHVDATELKSFHVTALEGTTGTKWAFSKSHSNGTYQTYLFDKEPMIYYDVNRRVFELASVKSSADPAGFDQSVELTGNHYTSFANPGKKLTEQTNFIEVTNPKTNERNAVAVKVLNVDGEKSTVILAADANDKTLKRIRPFIVDTTSIVVATPLMGDKYVKMEAPLDPKLHAWIWKAVANSHADNKHRLPMIDTRHTAFGEAIQKYRDEEFGRRWFWQTGWDMTCSRARRAISGLTFGLIPR